jgi:hypothetical protein
VLHAKAKEIIRRWSAETGWQIAVFPHYLFAFEKIGWRMPYLGETFAEVVEGLMGLEKSLWKEGYKFSIEETSEPSWPGASERWTWGYVWEDERYSDKRYAGPARESKDEGKKINFRELL